MSSEQDIDRKKFQQAWEDLPQKPTTDAEGFLAGVSIAMNGIAEDYKRIKTENEERIRAWKETHTEIEQRVAGPYSWTAFSYHRGKQLKDFTDKLEAELQGKELVILGPICEPDLKNWLWRYRFYIGCSK